MASDDRPQRGRLRLGRFFSGSSDSEIEKTGPSTWNMGMLNDRETVEVPGKYTWATILLLRLEATLSNIVIFFFKQAPSCCLLVIATSRSDCAMSMLAPLIPLFRPGFPSKPP